MAHDVLKMKTTLEIDESVVQRLREEAERQKTTMSDLVDAILRLALAMPEPAGTDPKPLPPLPTWQSGGFRVDIADREALYQVLDEA
ncbi:MAG: hypothetical protein OXC19_18180 [Bryobacterales bacterium]|nr:hypothetical protein [Bryobacterales bacterium]